MYYSAVVLAFLMISWSTSAMPCDCSWGTETGADIIGDVIPLEEIIISPVVEDEDIIADSQQDVVDSFSTSFEDDGVLVGAPQEEDILSANLFESNSETSAVAANCAEGDDDSFEDSEATTEKA